MTVGLIDVDGHRFPNLALMRISAWHKSQGDTVEWWMGDLFHYNRVYISKVFSFTPDVPDPVNCDEVVRGGTGYCITVEDGREVFNKAKNASLPPEIEAMRPDYTIYPQYDFAISMTSRGCPRGCSFCHVAAKEGRCSVKVANVSDFWNGQKRIEVLDPNIVACRDKRELFHQYRETGAQIVFNQGLDIRLMNDEDLDDINNMRIKDLHFAWDNPKDDLGPRFEWFARNFRRKSNIGMVYVLTNFGSSMEENLHRIYVLRDLGYDPYVMIYNKPEAPQDILDLQRWCNNKIIFKKAPVFEKYIPNRRFV